tara:strand:- start:36 stop:380 length:345 start_codon:yes stop_codon:yes gene_type:complete
MIYIYRSLFFLTFIFINYSFFTPVNFNEAIPHLDKILHFLAFLVLTLLLDASLRWSINSQKKYITFLIAYAGFIEFIQYFISYRSADSLDFLSDLLGILVYLYFAPKIYVKTSK